nr:MAG TPA: hypothetical protein [Caudoviricetes sp.]
MTGSPETQYSPPPLYSVGENNTVIIPLVKIHAKTRH